MGINDKEVREMTKKVVIFFDTNVKNIFLDQKGNLY